MMILRPPASEREGIDHIGPFRRAKDISSETDRYLTILPLLWKSLGGFCEHQTGKLSVHEPRTFSVGKRSVVICLFLFVTWTAIDYVVSFTLEEGFRHVQECHQPTAM